MSVIVEKVEIYSKANCQYCTTAKTVVTRREWPMEEKSIDEQANLDRSEEHTSELQSH